MAQYKAADGAHFSDEDAQKFGERIEILVETHGYISPRLILDDARSSDSSPFKNYLQLWDVEKAAESYWINRANNIIKSVVIVLKINEDTVEVRAFHLVKVLHEDNLESEWHPVIEVMSNEVMSKQVIERALHELNIWKNRYKQYAELAEMFKYIDEFQEKMILNE